MPIRSMLSKRHCSNTDRKSTNKICLIILGDWDISSICLKRISKINTRRRKKNLSEYPTTSCLPGKLRILRLKKLISDVYTPSFIALKNYSATLISINFCSRSNLSWNSGRFGMIILNSHGKYIKSWRARTRVQREHPSRQLTPVLYP